MQNWLIVSNNHKAAQQAVAELAQKENLIPDNIHWWNSEPQEMNIAQFRELLKLSYRHFSAPTLIVIDHFANLSEVIQNSFLKTLEEHQENLGFVLIANRLSAVLPTISSRCRVIKTAFNQTVLTAEEAAQFNQLVAAMRSEPGSLASFSAALGIKNKKDKAADFLDHFIYFAKVELLRQPQQADLAHWAARAIEMRELVVNNNLDPEMAIDRVFLY